MTPLKEATLMLGLSGAGNDVKIPPFIVFKFMRASILTTTISYVAWLSQTEQQRKIVLLLQVLL